MMKLEKKIIVAVAILCVVILGLVALKVETSYEFLAGVLCGLIGVQTMILVQDVEKSVKDLKDEEKEFEELQDILEEIKDELEQHFEEEGEEQNGPGRCIEIVAKRVHNPSSSEGVQEKE